MIQSNSVVFMGKSNYCEHMHIQYVSHTQITMQNIKQCNFSNDWHPHDKCWPSVRWSS